jgi:Family of unknown function (DUF6879)
VSRVHVVAESLTDYLRYELDSYLASVTAGEDILSPGRWQLAVLLAGHRQRTVEPRASGTCLQRHRMTVLIQRQGPAR